MDGSGYPVSDALRLAYCLLKEKWQEIYLISDICNEISEHLAVENVELIPNDERICRILKRVEFLGEQSREYLTQAKTEIKEVVPNRIKIEFE